MFEELIARWGYLAVGLGTFFEGETVLLAAGAFARKGLLALPWLLVCAIAGSVTWSQLWFHTGRRLGRFAIERRPAWRTRVTRIEHFMTRHGRRFVIGYRFIAGMGAVCPALLGASGYPPRRFLWLDSLGAAAWAAAFTGIGWGLAAGLGELLGRSTRVAELMTAAVTAGVLLWLGTKLAAGWPRNRAGAAE